MAQSDLQLSFVLTYSLSPDFAANHSAYKAAHEAHLNKHLASGILAAGLTRDPADGYIFIWRAPSKAVIENFVAQDPYVKAGLVVQHILREHEPSLGAEVATLKYGIQGPVSLYYFNLPGRAEFIRWILHYCSIPFKDVRIEAHEWQSYKNRFEFGQVPVLEIDGNELVTATGIGRYIATKYGLYPTDSIDIYNTESLIDYINDIHPIFDKIVIHARDSAAWELWLKFEGLEKAGVIESRLRENAGGQGFFIGRGITMLDFVVAAHFHSHYFHPGQESCLAELKRQRPLITGFVERFLASAPLVAFYLGSQAAH